jgi:hypothetical protein
MSDQPTARAWHACGDRATARRAAARQHHPDVGGSAAALTAAFAQIDRAYGHPGASADDVAITVVHRGFRARARALVVAGVLRSVMTLNAIRIRARHAGAARTDPHGARRAPSTSLEDQQ